MNQTIDNSLIDQAMDGDSDAFGEIYILLRGSIYGFAYRMLQETSMAEQFTQEAFMFLIESPERFDSSRGEILPFLCGIVRRKIIKHLRKHGIRFEFSEDDLSRFENENGSVPNPLNELLKEELNEKIEEKISELPVFLREALILREIEELSYREIANVTETNLNQVKIRIHRGRKRLAKSLKPHLAEGEEKYYELRSN